MLKKDIKKKKVYAIPNAIDKEVDKQKLTYNELYEASSSSRVTLHNVRKGLPITKPRAQEYADLLGVPFEQLFEWR